MLATVTFPAYTGGPCAYAVEHFATAKTLQGPGAAPRKPDGASVPRPARHRLQPAADRLRLLRHPHRHGDNHLGNQYTPSDGGAPNDIDTTFNNPFTVWRNLEVDLDLTTSKLELYLDSVPTLTVNVEPLTPAAFDMQLGVVSGGGGAATGPGTVHVDNVLVDTTM